MAARRPDLLIARPGTELTRLRSLAVLVVVVVVAGACVDAQRVSPDATDPAVGGALRSSASASPRVARPTSDVDPAPAPASFASPATAVPSTTPSALPTLPPRTQEPSIGYISLDESLPFVRAVGAGIRQAAAAAGMELHECDPGWSRNGVIDCAAELAQAGVHGVVSFQPFADLGADVCAAVGDAPVVGVVFDQGPCQVSRLTIDQAASGRITGEAVGAFAAAQWDCDVNTWVSLESSDADPDGRARMQGYRDGFEVHCPLPEQVLTLDGADRLVTAQTQMRDLLPDIKGKPTIVVGLNEDAILGAMAAVRAAGRESQFWYSGQLADPSIRWHIACDDHYIASVAQFPERFGTPVVAALVDAIDGREVAGELSAELRLVTSANVRELFPDTRSCEN